jgi:ADP-ribose pyrophosphatase YjhB (NUDIX family)
MPIPPFVVDIRTKIGHDLLWLPGVTAVVFDDQDRVLLVRRADDLRWTLVTGCLDPGEQPAAGAAREIEEETAVLVTVERVLAVESLPRVAYPNGDQSLFLDVAFRCRAIGGQARVNDDESVDVGWFGLDELPDLPERHLQCIKDAVSEGAAVRFNPA